MYKITDISDEFILVGGGGHARSIIDSIVSRNISEEGKYRLLGVIANEEFQNKSGIKYLGNDDVLIDYYKKNITTAFIGVGAVGYPATRLKIYNNLIKLGYKFINIIDNKAYVSNDIVMNTGNYIGTGAMIKAGVVLGKQNIINTKASIDHDCQLGDFIHISPGATLCGEVKVGNCTHIGAGCTVINGISIGCNTIIGAGSVVVKDIPDGVVAYGNPCRIIRKNVI